MLRTMVPSAEVGSNFVYFCSASVNLARNCAGFSSSLYFLELFNVDGFMSCLLKAHNEAIDDHNYGLLVQVSLPDNPSWDHLKGQPLPL